MPGRLAALLSIPLLMVPDVAEAQRGPPSELRKEANRQLEGIYKSAQKYYGSGRDGSAGRVAISAEQACRTQQNADACFEAGTAAHQSDPPKANELYRMGCELGHAKACNNGAVLLGDGDTSKAGEMWRRACELGDGAACASLAARADDEAKARGYLEKGCQHGYRPACAKLDNEAEESAVGWAVVLTLAALCLGALGWVLMTRSRGKDRP